MLNNINLHMRKIIALFAIILGVLAIPAKAQTLDKMDASSLYKEGCKFLETNKTEAAKYFKLAAKQGEPCSEFYLGCFYINGDGVNKDIKQGVSLLKKSADQGLPNAQLYLAQIYHEGVGVEKKYNDAYYWALKCAQNTDSKFGNTEDCITEAQFLVGTCYFYGTGISVDKDEAIKWYTKAADKGHLEAMYNLAYCMMLSGTRENKQKGFKLFQSAADKGHIGAQFGVALAYYNGDGVKRDTIKALEWLKKSAENNYSQAQGLLGQSYQFGQLVPKNISNAIKWYTKAADGGETRAMTQLGYIYLEGKEYAINYTKAQQYFSEAAKANDPEGYNALAYMYFRGNGFPKDSNKAMELIDKALLLSNNNPRYLDSKGEFLFNMGEHDRARAIYDEIIESAPNYYDQSNSDFFKLIQKSICEVNFNIPQSMTVNKNTFAVIIANENYQREANVPYAKNDGEIFAEYCKKALGLPDKNIRVVENATLNDIKYNINWLKQVIDVYGTNSHVIIYYAGHGIPDEKAKTAFLLPIDGYGNDPSTGYSLQELYQTLGQLQSKSVVAFLDACFSGTNRDGQMLQNARGIAIKVKANSPSGNLVVFSASKDDETAYPYKEKEHGMFTYYLLKKLQDTKGEATLSDICKYVTEEVRKQSIVDNGKLQNPTLYTSPSLGNTWSNWQLK